MTSHQLNVLHKTWNLTEATATHWHATTFSSIMHIQTHTIVELVRNHSTNKSQLVSVNTEYEVKLDVSDNRYVGLH